jgi:eukaryotic-like serine/threonine-protein kinase
VAVRFTAADAVARRPALVQRFKREAAIAAKVKSPHAVLVFDHGVTAEGVPYIVMELSTGAGSLAPAASSSSTTHELNYVNNLV